MANDIIGMAKLACTASAPEDSFPNEGPRIVLLVLPQLLSEINWLTEEPSKSKWFVVHPLMCRRNEALEQWVGRVRLALEFGMKLARDEIGV